MENKIKFIKEDELSKLSPIFDAIVINTNFEKEELADSSIINFKDTDIKVRYEKTISLIANFFVNSFKNLLISIKDSFLPILTPP